MAASIPPSLFPFLAQAPEAPAQDKSMVAFVLAMLLIGVAVVGVIMLVLVVIWGGRTRRITREEFPEVRLPDPFDSMRAETRRHSSSAVPDDAHDSTSPDSDQDGDRDGD